MSTTSPNFSLVIATTSDQVNVVTQIAGNFSSLDSILSIAHTGTGQIKAGLTITNPTFVGPTVTGTMSADVIVASTGFFYTVTATAGAVTLTTLSIGTYALPSTIGATNSVLTVLTGNAVWVAPSPGTGANQNLSNLSSVAINTSLGTFSAGFVTLNRVIATSGALTGLTTFQATTGTFAGSVTVTGTLTANVINCTGGSITAGALSVGTYAFPGSIGTTGQVMAVSNGTLGFATPVLTQTTAYVLALYTSAANITMNTSGGSLVPFDGKRFDTAAAFDTGNSQFTTPTSGYYQFSVNLVKVTGTASPVIYISGSTNTVIAIGNSGTTGGVCGSAVVVASSGEVFTVFSTNMNGTGWSMGNVNNQIGGVAIWSQLSIMKVPDR